MSRNIILTNQVPRHCYKCAKKKTTDNFNLDLVNINAYIKFGEFLSICSKDIKPKPNFGYRKGHNSGTNLRKMTYNNPKLDLVSMDVYIKFGENMSVCSQDFEQKLNFGENQGP